MEVTTRIRELPKVSGKILMTIKIWIEDLNKYLLR